MGLLLYPYFLLVFWYHEFFPRFAKKSYEILIYSAELLSLPLLITTFFQPLKSEYREGLVGFSIAMGVIVKTLILFAASIVVFAVFSLLVLINLIIATLPLLLIVFAI